MLALTINLGDWFELRTAAGEIVRVTIAEKSGRRAKIIVEAPSSVAVRRSGARGVDRTAPDAAQHRDHAEVRLP